MDADEVAEAKTACAAVTSALSKTNKPNAISIQPALLLDPDRNTTRGSDTAQAMTLWTCGATRGMRGTRRHASELLPYRSCHGVVEAQSATDALVSSRKPALHPDFTYWLAGTKMSMPAQ